MDIRIDDSQLETRIRELAAQRGVDFGHFAVAALQAGLEVLGEESDRLSDDEVAEIRAGIRRGLADGEAGKVQSLADWATAKRIKYGASNSSS